MHLVGFIIRTYHDARSPERQKRNTYATRYKLGVNTSHEFFNDLCFIVITLVRLLVDVLNVRMYTVLVIQ